MVIVMCTIKSGVYKIAEKCESLKISTEPTAGKSLPPNIMQNYDTDDTVCRYNAITWSLCRDRRVLSTISGIIISGIIYVYRNHLQLVDIATKILLVAISRSGNASGTCYFYRLVAPLTIPC